MSLAWISVAALVIAVTLSCTTTVNVGILSMDNVRLAGLEAVNRGRPLTISVLGTGSQQLNAAKIAIKFSNFFSFRYGADDHANSFGNIQLA